MSLLGLEIGGTKRVIVVGDHTGRPLARRKRAMRCTGDWRADLAEIVADAREVLAEGQAVGAGALEAIGVAAPGPVDLAAGMLRNPPNLPGWRDVPLVSELSSVFGVPVRIENDANAAALAEHRFGAGRGTNDLVYLTMSTGVGGGVISGGRLLRGARGFAGELGHVPIVREGSLCHCGLRGCLEAYVGGLAWAERLRDSVPAGSALLALAGGDRERLSSETLLLAARRGDALALAELGLWLDHLALGIAAVVMAFDPERIVLGTIAVAAGEELCFAPLRERVARLVWSNQLAGLAIVPAALGEALPELAALAVAAAAAPPTRIALAR